MNLGKASFFKIINRDSDDFISLSPTFTKKYMEKSNETQTILLKTNSSTAEWKVKYLKIDDKYYLMDGWLKFMNDNGVQMGDFLVFWLVSHSPTVFNVFFYAPNSCLKNQSSGSGNIDQNTPKAGHDLDSASAGVDEKETSTEEVHAYDVSGENIKKLMTKTFLKKYNRHIPLTKEFETATGIGGYVTLLLKNKEGKKWKVNIKRYNNHKQQLLHISKGWAKFVKDNRVEVGDKFEFNHVKGKLICVHVFKKKGRLFRDNKSNNVTDLESGKVVDSKKKFNSDNLHYMVTIRDSYIGSNLVCANAEFCRRYLTCEKKSVTCGLHSDGRNWGQVECKVYRTFARLYGKNWKKFSDENHLAVGDKCVFELINKIEKVLKVTIIRG